VPSPLEVAVDLVGAIVVPFVNWLVPEDDDESVLVVLIAVLVPEDFEVVGFDDEDGDWVEFAVTPGTMEDVGSVGLVAIPSILVALTGTSVATV